MEQEEIPVEVPRYSEAPPVEFGDPAGRIVYQGTGPSDPDWSDPL